METKPTSRTPTLIWLIVSQLFACAVLMFWGVMTLAIVTMAMDLGAPTSILILWAYPLCPIAFAIAAWAAYARKKDELAALFTTLTLLPVGVLVLFLILSPY